MAKKKTTTKKKSTAPKTTSAKKPAPKKKTTSAKKVGVKKAPAKKPTTKKKPTTAEKPSAKKKTTSKKAPVKKAPVKKSASAPSAKKAGSVPKSATKPKSKAKTGKTATKAKTTKKKVATGDRFRGTSTANFKAGQAAAARLAAAAGLHRLQSTSNGDTDDHDYEKLTKSPYPRRELNRFKKLLLEKRAQLVGDVSAMESEALTGGGGGSLSHVPQHMADQGSDTYDQSLALDLAASQRDLLREIDAAIDRIDNNTFGICEMLGKPISEDRLENTPWARFSIEAARRIERVGYQR